MTSRELVDILMTGGILTHTFFGRNGKVSLQPTESDDARYNTYLLLYADDGIKWSKGCNKQSMDKANPSNILKHIFIDTLNFYRDQVMLTREDYMLLKKSYNESDWSVIE
jgi:hypothetical protein